MKSILHLNSSPIAENQNRGYHFHVNEQQIKAHQKRSIIEIFAWIESTNRFLHQIQQDNEKMRIKLSKTIQND